jgi:F-type H+-transporting ATPase subunit b
MPQLDFSSFISQIFWLLIIISTMYLLFAKIAVPSIQKVISMRQDKVTSLLDRAESYRQEAEKLAELLNNAMTEHKAQLANIMMDVEQKVRKIQADQDIRVKEEVTKLTQAAKADIEHKLKEEKDSMKQLSVQLVQDIVKNFINIDLSKEEVLLALEGANKEDGIR